MFKLKNKCLSPFLFLILLPFSVAFAASSEEKSPLKVIITGEPLGLNGRSAPNFVEPKYISTTLPPGTIGELEKAPYEMSTGNTGYFIKITSSPKNPDLVGKKYWVYHDKKNPRLKLDPEIAKQKDYCYECSTDQSKAKPLSEKNRQNISEVVDQVAKDENTPQTMDETYADQKLEKFLSSGKARELVSVAIKKSKGTHGQCYGAVKNALVGAKILSPNIATDPEQLIDPGNNLPFRPPRGVAINALKEFSNRGLINLLDFPKYKNQIKTAKDAPLGAMLVYSSGPLTNLRIFGETCVDKHSCGHIAIKSKPAGQSGEVSDHVSKTSINENGPASSRYVLVGVFIPNLKD